MSQKIIIENHGALITATNFWESDAEKAGKLFLSPNAGTLRLLVPRIHRSMIEEMRTARHVVCSLGPWPAANAEIGVELLFDDGSGDPYSVHLTPAACAMLPGEPALGQEWTLTVWDLKKGTPHKALERKCFWRRVEKLPCLKPWPAQ